MSSRKGKQKLLLIIAVVALFIIIFLVTSLSKIIDKYVPSSDVVDMSTYYNLESEDSLLITYDDETMDWTGIVQDGEAYLPYEFVINYLNCRFYWDSTEQLMRYALPEGIIETVPDTDQYTIGDSGKQAEHVICTVQSDQMYLSASFVKEYTDIHYEVYDSPNRIVISDQFDSVTYNNVKKATQLRTSGGIKSEIIKELSKGDYVRVLDQMDTWSEVCTEDGFVGYMKNSAIGDTQDIVFDHEYTEPYFNHIQKDFEINMVWDMVSSSDGNYGVSSRLASTKGVNVISPTWITTSDNKGNITSAGSTSYVSTCHDLGLEVWAMVTNGENVSSEKVLDITTNRDALVNNVIAEAIKLGVDGINLDFEDLPEETGPAYLEFIRELSYKCENNNLVLSVDNYPPASYNNFYNLKEQSVFADYVAIMAYDEHYEGSDAGSVSSVSYVTNAVNDTIEQGVDHSQIILGLPFYTRMWKTDQDGNVTSETLTMAECDEKVANNNATLELDETTGQYYTEFTFEDATYQIWVEDQNSLETKLEIMQTNNLAGAAFWRLGYEKSMVWDTIINYLQ